MMFLISLLIASSYAISIPFRRADPPHSTTVEVNPTNTTTYAFSHAKNLEYTATIYVNGVPFEVVLDTGSSDLWIDTKGVDVPGLLYTGTNASVSYVDGSVSPGQIDVANVTLGAFTVENQAFINSPGSNVTLPGYWNGLLGLGGPQASEIWSALEQANSSYSGNHFLDNVFSFYPGEPNFITFLLSRSELGITAGGVFTIAEVDGNHTNITEAPPLNVLSPSFPQWATSMDGIRINGELVNGHSLLAQNLSSSLENKTLVILDTGTSGVGAPPYYVDALYKNIPGAVFHDVIEGYEDRSSGYLLPCDTKINASMVFGDREFPIHPIDLIDVTFAANGTFTCFGAFTYIKPGSLDFLLGDTFLRNVYSLFDYGNWTTVGDGTPFMQILSTTDADSAWAEADSMMLNRILQFENNYQATVSTGPTASSSPTSTANAGLRLGGALADTETSSSTNVDISGLMRSTYIIMGLVAVLVVLLIAVAVLAVREANKGYKRVLSVWPPTGSGKRAQSSSLESYWSPYTENGE
ncbi:Aspartic protease [Grifola frondosa]|uniref:Aspartic protease n=1 Tax=Grifola frondosa TaxID=5627 RepID=A0A1C7LN92_GRIFR|nr:Aspartic protease [Grifola frondosa]